jgi:hypothetical protein
MNGRAVSSAKRTDGTRIARTVSGPDVSQAVAVQNVSLVPVSTPRKEVPMLPVDSMSSAVFIEIFEEMAKSPTPETKAMAKRIWDIASKTRFHWHRAACRSALVTLELARRVPSQVIEGRDTVVYLGEKGFEEAAHATTAQA